MIVGSTPPESVSNARASFRELGARASLRPLLARCRRRWPQTLVVLARQIPRMLFQVKLLQGDRARESRARMRPELLQLIFELAEPLVAVHWASDPENRGRGSRYPLFVKRNSVGGLYVG